MMNRKWFRMILFVILSGGVLAAGLAFTRGVSAQAPTPQPDRAVSDNDVNRVAKKLYCPVCPNTPLDVCETQACIDWRAQIRDQMSSGWTDQQVIDSFVKQYGERVLAEPERGGFTSLVWMLPVLVAGLGLLLVWLILKSWRVGQKAHPAVAQHSTDIPGDVLAKIEAEIRELD